MIDWTRLLAESFRDFMTAEGIDSSNLKDKLSVDLLKRFLEKFAGTADPDQLRRQLADGPGAVGFFISFMLALPAEGRFASVLILSEVMKAAGLPIPPAVRTAVIAAFEATGEIGITDEDIQRYRSRVLTAVSGVTPSTVATAGAIAGIMAMGAMIYSKFTTKQIESAPPALEDKPMSTPPDPADPSLSPPVEVDPLEPTENRKKYFDFLLGLKPLREDEVVDFPKRQTDYWRGVGWVQEHLDDPNPQVRKKARTAFACLPDDVTTAEFGLLKEPLAELRRVRLPRASRPSQLKRDEHTTKVFDMFKRSFIWDEAVRKIGREQSWFLKIPLADKLDDLVTDGVRDSASMLAHLGFTAVAASITALLYWFEQWDLDKPLGMFVLSLGAGFTGASALTLIGRFISHSGVIDRLYTGKGLGGEERNRTDVEVAGILLMVLSLTVGVMQLALWLAPGFGALKEYQWLFSPFVLNIAMFGIWGAPFAILSNDPWLNKIEPIFVGKDGKQPVDKYGNPVASALHKDEHAEEEAAADKAPAKAEKAHGKDDKGHGHAEPTVAESDSVDQLLEDKSKRQGLVVPGRLRPGNLKISLGGTLVGMCMNVMWALSGEALPSRAWFVAGFFLMLTILTVAQYFGALLPIKWMQKFIQGQVVGPAIYPIVAMFALSFFLAGGFSNSGQFQLMKNFHCWTDTKTGVVWTKEESLACGVTPPSAPPESRTASTTQTYVSTTTVVQTPSCPDRDWLESQTPGYCTEYPDFAGCKCE